MTTGASLINAFNVLKTPVIAAHVLLDDGDYFVRTNAVKGVHVAASVLERAYFLVPIFQVLTKHRFNLNIYYKSEYISLVMLRYLLYPIFLTGTCKLSLKNEY